LGLDREIAGLLCVVFVVVAVLTGLLVYGDEFSVSWLPGVGPENVELVQRMVTDVGWFGSGAGTFRSLAKIYQEFGHSEETVVPPAIRLLVEWGWPAAICLAYVALRLIVLLFRSSLFRGRDYFFSAAASACVSCLLLNVVFYPSSMNPTVLVFADIIVGLGLAQSTGQHNRGRSWA
jgi:hypothetical protein